MSSKRIDITTDPEVYVSVFDDGRIELCAPHADLQPTRRGGRDLRPGRGSRWSFTAEPITESSTEA
jgi:hypothetical protein